MVVKPMDFVTRGRKGLAQPEVKCRGREYLRIIYGPEYTTAENRFAGFTGVLALESEPVDPRL